MSKLSIGVRRRLTTTGLFSPSQGVVTLFGYGISVRVDRGHLLIADGIGPDRRQARFPRVGHGLKRLVVIGSDGMVSLAALRWLAKPSEIGTLPIFPPGLHAKST